jgi:cation transport ATPase
MTKLNLKIEHQVRGRIRLKIPSGKGNPELLAQIKETLGVIPGIEQVTVNPTTGSVVLHYDEDRHDQFHGDLQRHMPTPHRPPSNEIDEIARKFEEEAEFLAEHSQAARAVVDFCKDLDRRVKTATGNLIDLKIVFAVAIIGFTVLEVGASAATPVWVTLVIFSLNHFIEMHPPGAKAAQRPAVGAA